MLPMQEREGALTKGYISQENGPAFSLNNHKKSERCPTSICVEVVGRKVTEQFRWRIMAWKELSDAH